jgi:splicing suppressor protein 51
MSGEPVIAKGLDTILAKPFTHLYNKTWLHNRSEQDVFRLLIDCFRLKLEDDYKFEGDVPVDSLYSGEYGDSRIPFKQFLKEAEKRKGLLPSWWNQDKQDECIAFGLTDSWANLASVVEKSDLINRYGDSMMPMQLRMLSEQITGRGPMGQSGLDMMKMQMSREVGVTPYVSTIDMTRMQR